MAYKENVVNKNIMMLKDCQSEFQMLWPRGCPSTQFVLPRERTHYRELSIPGLPCHHTWGMRTNVNAEMGGPGVAWLKYKHHVSHLEPVGVCLSATVHSDNLDNNSWDRCSVRGGGPTVLSFMGWRWPQVRLTSDSLRLAKCIPLKVTLSFLQPTVIFQGEHILCGEEMSVKFKNFFSFTFRFIFFN